MSAHVGEIAPTIQGLLLMAGKTWEIRDPVCGGKLVEIAPDVAREIAATIDVNEKAAKFFNDTIGNPGMMRLLITVLPLITTVGAHHVAPAIAARRAAAVAATVGDGLHYEAPPITEPVGEAPSAEPTFDSSFVAGT